MMNSYHSICFMKIVCCLWVWYYCIENLWVRSEELAVKVAETDADDDSAADTTTDLMQKLSAAKHDAFASHCR